MAPQKKQFNADEIEEDATKNLYRCKICFAVHSSEAPWMQRGSVKAHLDSNKHAQNFRSKAIREQEEASEREKYRRTYSTSVPLAAPDPSFRPHLRRQPPDMFASTSGDTTAAWDQGSAPYPTPDDLFIGSQTPPPEADVDDLLSNQFQELLAQALHLDEFGPDDDDAELDIELEQDDDVLDFDEELNSGEYAPYPNKVAMLLDILDNLPRLRLSSNSIKLILWMLKTLGVSNVPSYNKFRGMQESLRKECGITPDAHVSDFKNHFHSIDPRVTVARDFSNPQIAEHITLYPERTDGPRSETWQFERWTEYTPSQLTPMFARGLKQFWIEEVAQLDDGSYVIPHNLITVVTAGEKVLSSDCSNINVTPHGWALSETTRTVPASRFMFNYDDVIARVGNAIQWAEGSTKVPEMPNPLRTLADGDDLYVVMLPLWCDDVSGNKSKQYNKHINIYSVNGSLPGQLLQQEYFVNFVSTSPHATSLEQFTAIRNQVNETAKNPVRCYNAHTGRMCRVILRVPMLPADNPQQSEEASHIGGTGNRPCRKCMVGGGYKATETPDGYHSFFCSTEGIRRSAEEIKTELAGQLRAAMTGVEATVTKKQTASGVKDKITEVWIAELIAKARKLKEEGKTEEEIVCELQEWLEKQPGEKMNPLYDIAGLDPSQDTPVEILHSVLLGIVKYVWHMSHTSMTEKELELLAVRLQSADTDGLTVPPLRAAYMVQYRNNLIGKHFKTLMQLLPFHIHSFAKLGTAHFKLVRSIGALGSMLWVSEIKDLDQYLDDLDILVGNVLDAFADIDPSKVLIKIKIHLLAHLRDDIRRFGPLIRYSTEIFEAFNAVFRLCSIYSNHQAPSRDIAFKFTSIGRVKHILSGGYWEKKNVQGESRWVQAAEPVRRILRDVPIIQQHLGWVPKPKIHPGKITFKSQRAANLVTWSDSKASLGSSETPPSQLQWLTGERPKVVATTGDSCTVGSWVFVKTVNNEQVIGRVIEILMKKGTSTGIVTVEQFELGAHIHEDFQCPILRRPVQPALVAVKSQSVLFRFSAQHDCRLAQCQPTHRVRQIQERQITDRTQFLLKHANDDNFVVNMYALHNATVIREALPRELWKPIPLYQDRRGRHDEIVKTLQLNQTEKRAKTQEKSRATRARNQAAAQRNQSLQNAGASTTSGAEGRNTEVSGQKRPRVENDAEAEDSEERPVRQRRET